MGRERNAGSDAQPIQEVRKGSIVELAQSRSWRLPRNGGTPFFKLGRWRRLLLAIASCGWDGVGCPLGVGVGVPRQGGRRALRGEAIWDAQGFVKRAALEGNGVAAVDAVVTSERSWA